MIGPQVQREGINSQLGAYIGSHPYCTYKYKYRAVVSSYIRSRFLGMKERTNFKEGKLH